MTTQERASKEIETHQSNFISVLNITKDLNLQLDGKFMIASKVHSRSVDVDTEFCQAFQTRPQKYLCLLTPQSLGLAKSKEQNAFQRSQGLLRTQA